MNREDIEALIRELRRTHYMLRTLEDVDALPPGSKGYFSGPGAKGHPDSLYKDVDGEWGSEWGYYGTPDASWLPFTLWESGDLRERAARALEGLTRQGW